MEKKFVIVTPEMFKSAFLDTFSYSKDKLLAAWDSRKEYTILIQGNKSREGLLSTIANKLGLNYMREYWSLDGVFYKYIDTQHFTKYWSFAEYIAVAVEHENDIWTSNQEINKLSIINAPLKVLITYPDKEGVDIHLQSYTEIIKKSDIFSDFSDHRKQLVIFGLEKDEDIVWEFYLYKQGQFSKLLFH